VHPAKGLSTLGNTGSVAQDIDMTQRTIRVQSLDECLQLLEGEQVGRLVYVDEGGPAAVPVNYVLDQGRVVFRTEAGSKTAALAGPIAFEVDRIDTGDQSGWSVLIRGEARELPIEEVPAMLQRVGQRIPRPWAAGVHNQWIVVHPSELTGRRLDVRFYAPAI
jgi:nitroimidazol reductase NimA-like FMN-containing flavoprotein (pyridoxamine 5'-phosphate oxidase superfamily)